MFAALLDRHHVQYKRQHQIHMLRGRKCFLDFYVPAQKIGFEIDGYRHFTPIGYKQDRRRTKAIRRQACGIRLIYRIPNREVLKGEFSWRIRVALALARGIIEWPSEARKRGEDE